MIQKSLIVTTVFVASLASALAASPVKTFTYRVQVPATAATCEQEATSFNVQFSQATGLAATTACQSQETIEDLSVYTLVSTYQAEAAIAPYQASFSSEGVYSTYTACLADLNGQESTFKTMTGLSVLSAGCARATIGEGFTPYIDGMGTPKLQLFSVSPGFDSGLTEVPSIVDVYKAHLESAGAIITLKTDHDIFYYAANRIEITTNWITAYDTDSHYCEMETKSAQQAFASFHDVTPVTSCLNDELFGRTYLIVSWIGNAFPVTSDHAINSAIYGTFDQCQQDKARAMQNDQSNGVNATGAVCETNPVGSGFVMEVFSAPAN